MCRRFHFSWRRVAGISLLPDAIFLAASARIFRRGWIETDGRERTRLHAASLGNGNWRVVCIARSTRIYQRILSCYAIRRRCINRLSISECIPNFIEIHRRPAYLASCYYHLRIFQGETMSLGIFLCALLHRNDFVLASSRLSETYFKIYKIIRNIFINFTRFCIILV